MLPRKSASSGRHATLFAHGLVRCALASPLSAAEFGPPPNAHAVGRKAFPIDEFINEQIATGKIPGAIVLIQRHGKPVYFKMLRQARRRRRHRR